MKVVKLQSGLLAHRLTPDEQNKIFIEVSKDIGFKPTDPQYFRDKTKPYYLLKQVEVKPNKFISTIRANEKIFKVKHDICNEQEKICKAVIKAYA